MKTLYILIGASGSGKSTLAKQIKDTCSIRGHPTIVLSTDNYFMKDGEYRFRLDELSKAHQWNFNRFLIAIEEKFNTIILDNTNVAFSHFQRYIDVAAVGGYNVEYCSPRTPWAEDLEVLNCKNVHQVPKETLAKQLAQAKLTNYVVALETRNSELI